MKLTVVLMIISFLQVSAAGYAQKVSLVQKDASLEKTLRAIRKQTGFNILCDSKILKEARPISVQIHEAPLEKALQHCFAGQPLTYTITNRTIIINRISETSLIATNQIAISGKVTDNTGVPLPGAAIKVKGTTLVTITDNEGQFQLKNVNDDAILIISYLGFITQEIAVNKRNTVYIILQEASKGLNEIVVIGYGTQKRENVTNAISTVKPEDFNQGATRNAMDLIQGKVSGLTITRANGNNPNAGASIQLRGVISLSGTIAPLIVIDGIPGGNLDLLQPDDIESFDILKDGSAAAIYGTRASGGVILITTKKGKEGPPKYDYSNWFSRDKVAKRPDILTAEEYRALKADPTNTRAGSMTDLGQNINWYDLLIKDNNLSQYHNLSASGGSLNSNYRASVYYRDDEGVTLDNDRRQFGGRINVNQKGLKDRLSAQLNLATNFNKATLDGGNNTDFEQAVIRNPTEPVYENGTFRDPISGDNYNPLARLMDDENIRQQQTFSGDLKLTLDIIKGLKASAFGALVSDRRTDGRYVQRHSRLSRASYNGAGYAAKSNSLSTDRTFETTLNYTPAINHDHSINILGGYGYQYFVDESFNVSNSGFTTDAFDDYNIKAGTAFSSATLRQGADLGSGKSDNTIIGFFGRVNYAFKGKYLAQLSLRHEGSSRFGANYKWGNFPAVSLGWNISREYFMENVHFVNNLKLRAGFGVTGNNVNADNLSVPTLSNGGLYPIDGVWYQTYGPSRNPNPNLRWEKKKELNIGADFSLLGNRLGGSIDVFNRVTEDLIAAYNTQLPPFIHSTVTTNVGSIQNKGVELTLHAVPLKKKNFSWNTDVLFSAYKNTLKALSDNVYKATFLSSANLPAPGNLGSAIRTEEGKALGSFYGKRFAGFTDDGKWLFYKADGTTGTASTMTNNDLAYIGNGVPKWMLGWNNTFSYKNLDLTAFFRGKFDFDILNTHNMYYGNLIGWLPNNVLNYAVENRQINDGIQYSDYYLEKGDFVKLDNLTLRYKFKLKTSYLRNLSVYATGRNILTITGYSGLDPEVQDTGREVTGVDNRGFYPRTRTWSLGLNVGF